MQFAEKNKKIVVLISVITVLVCLPGYFFVELGPVAPSSTEIKSFQISAGDGFGEIMDRLTEGGIIKSATAFKILAVLSGMAGKLKPGIYELNPATSGIEILLRLVSGSRREVSVTIPEGLSIYDMDRILSNAGIIKTGGLVYAVSSTEISGMLFPDTYRFFTNSEAGEVINKFLENFDAKTELLLGDKKLNDARQVLILASLIEKEVPDFEDQRIVAGIMKKRLKSGMPLQVDATICYIKLAGAYPDDRDCYPLSTLDFKSNSPYNTYLHSGLPPDPIGNPGVSAINAALNPISSPYWYYLSDPKTHKTIFSQTLDEQEQNRIKYLKS